MQILFHLPLRWSHVFLSLLLLVLSFQGTYSIPQSLFIRRDSLASLQVPQCALQCFLDAILDDGCANEADFACHCAAGNILDKATVCVAQACSNNDANDAVSKIQSTCNAFHSATSSTTTTTTTTTDKPSRTTSPASSSTIQKQEEETTPLLHLPIAPTPSATTFSTSVFSSRTAPPSNATTMPINLLPPSNQLSGGAKTGIAVSVGTFALSVFLGLGWYIRRLKRDLRHAQAAISQPRRDTWRSSVDLPPPIALVRSREARRGRRSSRGSEMLVSPLSPRSMQQFTTITDNGYGVVKRKRGEVLSVVMESGEDNAGASVRQPVPGQREGLTTPLELDGEWTGVQEMPLVITPRNQSVDAASARDRGNGYVL